MPNVWCNNANVADLKEVLVRDEGKAGFSVFQASTLFTQYELTILNADQFVDASEVEITLWFRGRQWSVDKKPGCDSIKALCERGQYGPCFRSKGSRTDCVQRSPEQTCPLGYQDCELLEEHEVFI